MLAKLGRIEGVRADLGRVIADLRASGVDTHLIEAALVRLARLRADLAPPSFVPGPLTPTGAPLGLGSAPAPVPALAAPVPAAPAAVAAALAPAAPPPPGAAEPVRAEPRPSPAPVAPLVPDPGGPWAAGGVSASIAGLGLTLLLGGALCVLVLRLWPNPPLLRRPRAPEILGWRLPLHAAVLERPG
jgi:hypothetical protein